MTGEERVEEMVEVGTEGDGGEVGRSLGFGVPASKRGTITTGWARGGKSLFHFRGRQSVRRRGRCGLRRPCQRPGGERDKRRGREPNAPRLRFSHKWRRSTDDSQNTSVPIDSCRIIQNPVAIVQDKDRRRKME